MRFFRFGCLGILGLLIILSVAPRQIMKLGIRTAEFSPDGKYSIAILRYPMLFSMPGGGSDAPCDVFLLDAAGKELNSTSVDMVQLVSVSWQGDRVRIGDMLDEWELPKIDNINILLFSAAYTGDRAAVEKLLAKNADIHFKTYLNQTLLHAAAFGPNQAIVQLFLQKGLDVRDFDKSGQTPLHAAAAGRGSGAIDLLIASGADMEAIDLPRHDTGQTALNIAAESGNSQAMKALIERGAKVNDNTFFSVINRFESEKKKQEIIELLLKNKPQVPSGLLYSAVSGRNIEIVKLLIDRGADVNAPDPYDNTTLLMRIVQFNTGISPQLKPALVKLFLAKGADVNARNKNGATALSIAYKSSTPEIVKLLKQHGAQR
ncbi:MULTISPECIES: ankyrin repeat domain-containing protein [unclassified Microcoleus]|uniref:ankyrin repeat domain-containing protein n=1 Tax=unclassified Microcoleus TaxID=2642155 RepID=UPI001DDC179B|nr:MULTISPECIES: ankyrin repeat domain-containing protein [unclassified Microcoleus]MCC3412064.1 ankyrin repeat domain-containing protein [Microcoleus sp. PH2017_02_FOX_O_A]MCC3516185.1 ankyrin repeat domain-containing protein [Microcoleus sp. PH2017_18_LLB_O_A]